jgi:secreted Zn-dependent insulinase-like peptidase
MNLVLVGNQSIDDLKKLANDKFKDVGNKDLVSKDYSQEVVFTKDHSF